MSRRGGTDQAPKAQIRIIGAKDKGTKVGTMVTSSLMQMLTARGLFSGLPPEDPHA